MFQVCCLHSTDLKRLLMLSCWCVTAPGVWGVLRDEFKSQFSELGREFGLGCFINSAEGLCRRDKEQAWIWEQGRKVDVYSETGEIGKLRTCGGISL